MQSAIDTKLDLRTIYDDQLELISNAQNTAIKLLSENEDSPPRTSRRVQGLHYSDGELTDDHTQLESYPIQDVTLLMNAISTAIDKLLVLRVNL